MKKGKKILSFVSSMKFGIMLMLLVLAACVAGSLIAQGESASYYTSEYSGFLSTVVLKLRLDDVFHTWWFAVLTALLCLNLLCCNVIHFRQFVSRGRELTCENARKWSAGDGELVLGSSPEPLFEAMGLRNLQSFTGDDGKHGLYAVRNRAGVWGSWLTHLGILVVIAGFSLGQMFTVKYSVYGVAGQTKPVEGTPYEMTVDDFQIPLRDDDTVVQYISRLTMTDTETGESRSGEASVNHPLELFGMKVYQNTTGWAADAVVFSGGEEVQREIVCAGEYTTIEAIEELYLVFRAFYPDYVKDGSGMPSTASSRLDNPAYLYMLYYGDRLLGMNTLMPGEKIEVEDITITFEDPRPYTLLQLKRDPFTAIPLAGGIILMAALLLAFYFRTEELCALDDGEVWRIYARSKKGGLLYREKLHDKAEELSERKCIDLISRREADE